MSLSKQLLESGWEYGEPVEDERQEECDREDNKY